MISVSSLAEGFRLLYRCPSAAKKKAEGRRMKAEGFSSSIRVYLRLSRSNVRFLGVLRTINHPELTDVIGTGFICG
jgi:hypothetical protein